MISGDTPESILAAIETVNELISPLEGSGADGLLITNRLTRGKGAAVIAAVQAGQCTGEAAFFVRWG